MDGEVSVFDRVMRRLLERYPDDRPGRMLHAPGLKTGGRFYAFAAAGDVVLKLPAARVAELVAAGAGRACDPRGGRPMRCWVRVVAGDERTCTAYLLEAREFVADLPTR